MGEFKHLLVAIASVAALGMVVATFGVAAVPTTNEHGSFTDGPFDADFCAVPGTEIDTGVFHFLQDSSGAFVGNENFSGRFTATATGKSLEISAVSTGRGALIDNGDGTATFSEHDTGLVLRFKVANGPVLKDADGKPILGAGVLDFAVTFDLASGDVISVDESWHGPHPLRDGVDVCGPAIAYLTS